MKLNKLSIRGLKLVYLLFFLNIYSFTAWFGKSIPRGTPFFTLCGVFFALLIMATNGRLTYYVFHEMKAFSIYAIYILLSGLILIPINGYSISLVYPFFEELVIFALAGVIIYQDGSYNFVLFTGLAVALLDSIYALMHMGTDLSYRVEISSNVSANILGVICAFGVIATFFIKNKYMNKYIIAVMNGILIAAAVIAGSRQSLLIVAVVYIGICFIHFKNTRVFSMRYISVSTLLFVVFFVVAIVYLLNNGLYDKFISTNLFSRLSGTNSSTEISDNVRILLYINGFNTFMDSPFIGVGFNSPLYSYSHSTFIEVLAGTGIIGFIIFFSPFIGKTIKHIKGLKGANNSLYKLYCMKKLVLMAAIIVMMITRAIHYYLIVMALVSVFIFDLDEYTYLNQE